MEKFLDENEYDFNLTLTMKDLVQVIIHLLRSRPVYFSLAHTDYHKPSDDKINNCEEKSTMFLMA
jgi:hypothetical protein